jgi:hypothetical protein
MVLYALHDAVVKPMPDNRLAPCLAQSFAASEDGLGYEFVLRDNAKFHNGEPVTAEDVKFSFERYRGASHDLIKDRVAAVETSWQWASAPSCGRSSGPPSILEPEVQEGDRPGGQRRLRQRRNPARNVRRQGRALRLWQRPRNRHALSAASR